MPCKFEDFQDSVIGEVGKLRNMWSTEINAHDPIDPRTPAMIASEARTRAAQANGKKSQGPITPEGKAISRANSLKHGMTGAGVVLPLEDAAEVSNLFDDLHAQFNPSTPLGKILVQRIALSAVRLRRSAEEEAAYLGEKIRNARDEYDDRRSVEIAAELISGLEEQPSLSVRFDCSDRPTGSTPSSLSGPACATTSPARMLDSGPRRTASGPTC